MSLPHRSAVRAVVAAALAGDRPGAEARRLTVSQASPWVELHNARVRLLAGAPAAKACQGLSGRRGDHDGGRLEDLLAHAGRCGRAADLRLGGLDQRGAIKVLYPAPTRLPEAGAETIGYKRSVLFPVEVTPQDPAKPVELKLAMEFGVCRDICIPAEAKFSLSLPPAECRASRRARCRPRSSASRAGQPAGATSDPSSRRVAAILDGAAPRLAIEARFPRGSEGADLFIEAPDGLYVPLPKKRLPDAASGTGPLRGGPAARRQREGAEGQDADAHPGQRAPAPAKRAWTVP